MLNMAVIFVFPVLNQKYHFWQIRSRKSKYSLWAEIGAYANLIY